jgi:serine/threonine protein phosphatase 1
MTQDNEIDTEHLRLYVIGDIHGRLDLLKNLIQKIRRDAETCAGESLTVTLGDYIDRGPDSFGVLDCLTSKPFPAHYIALKGNHEALLGAFLRDPAIGLDWLRLGGKETMSSYGLSVPSTLMPGNYQEMADQLRASIPPEHLRFLETLKTSLISGRYFLCHAGIRPGVPFELQSEDDLLWIRDEFLSSQADFGKLVVHGHTPTEWPDIRPNRINIDTGAFASGRLTCVVLENESRRFLQASQFD